MFLRGVSYTRVVQVNLSFSEDLFYLRLFLKTLALHTFELLNACFLAKGYLLMVINFIFFIVFGTS